MRRDQPPYLLGDPDCRARGQTVTVLGDFDTALAEITVHGCWSAALKTAAATALRDCLVSRPAGIIADLRGLADAAGASAALWSAARLWGTQTPDPVPLMVCLPAAAPLAAILTRRGVRWGLPVHPSPARARAALTSVAARPDRMILRLDSGFDTLSPVTHAVVEACAAWELPSLSRLGCAVLTELVANAIEHAGSRVDVAITRHRLGLRLTVQDRNPRFPSLTRAVAREPGDPEGRGRGLRVVHTATTAWGALPSRDGKIVWAVLTAAPDARPARGHAPHPTRSPDQHG
jgi:hypothetical protein